MTPRDRRSLREKVSVSSKIFGHIPHVPIFTQWDRRMDCANAAVHQHNISGISGTGASGVYSLVLSNLYQDDKDGGDVIIYSGQGGKQRWSETSPRKRLRCGRQIKDQSWNWSTNKALMVSSLTGNPVRLVRSWKCPSQYAPLQGYRYDGLYKVTACWTGKTRNGLKVCRCRLERLPDQPPIPVRPFRPGVLRPPGDYLVDPTSYHSTFTLSSTQSTGNAGTAPMTLDTEVPDQRQGSSRPAVLPIYKWYPKERLLVRVEQPPHDEDVHMAEEERRGDGDASNAPGRTETAVFPDGGD